VLAVCRGDGVLLVVEGFEPGGVGAVGAASSMARWLIADIVVDLLLRNYGSDDRRMIVVRGDQSGASQRSPVRPRGNLCGSGGSTDRAG
jgi:hypothetical protein